MSIYPEILSCLCRVVLSSFKSCKVFSLFKYIGIQVYCDTQKMNISDCQVLPYHNIKHFSIRHEFLHIPDISIEWHELNKSYIDWLLPSKINKITYFIIIESSHHNAIYLTQRTYKTRLFSYGVYIQN